MTRAGLDTLLPQCSWRTADFVPLEWPKRRKGLFRTPCPACAVPACVALLVVLWHRVP